MNLFNKKFVARQIAATAPPDRSRVGAFRDWAADIANGKIATHSEVSLHGPFVQKILIEGLGYRGPIGHADYNVTQEQSITRGSVDVAIGAFTLGRGEIIAPFELKGADTKNLDAIMPGRAKTPIDQAWEYATNNVGSKWVLVSNYLEIRLYSYAEGRQFYEAFDLSKLHEDAEFARAQLLLSAESLTSGRTLQLLEDSKRENKDITGRLYLDYKALRSELIAFVRQERADLDPLHAIRVAQTILDRILFIAFAEDTGLLPSKILERAFETRNAFAPTPVWSNFLGLFEAIDGGSTPLNVPRYNGGLFAPDPTITGLKVPDTVCEGFKRLSEYDFASEVSVTVLGHIFEQSIADVEQLQAEARGELPVVRKVSGTTGRRKRDGVVYTPDFIAAFIVENTLGTHCREIFVELLQQYARKGATPDDDPIKWKSNAAEKAFWNLYREKLAKLRIVDPACGSGVFLVAAFDWLQAELTRCNMRLEALGEGALFEVDREILTNNLFGVDVNEESVEIAKLSLWIKTARHGKVLDSLDDNFKVGDSLIEDANYAYRSHGFGWDAAFSSIFAEGGFDVVLGNPPYVRMELIKPMKPWLEKRYEVVADRADLYAYFFERGLKLLKPGGRLGYISSSTFFKTGSGAPLRDFLRSKATIENVIDFGDHQIFDGVTTYPAILTMKAGAPPSDHHLRFWRIDDLPREGFSEAYESHAKGFPQRALQRGSWELESDDLRALRSKITDGKPTLRDIYGPTLYGIKTGLNAAFVIDSETKERICRQDPTSADLLRPFFEGRDLKRWRAEPRDLWIIYIPRNKVEIDRYPAVKEWLLPFKERLEARATKQEWFELQQAQEAYLPAFAAEKIIYGHFQDSPIFSIDRTGALSNNKTYFVPSSDGMLLALLNSKLAWFWFTSQTTAVRGGFYEATAQHMERLPLPAVSNAERVELARYAHAAQVRAEKRFALQQSVSRRIPDLAPDPTAAKLTTRLCEWWKMPNFAAFQQEVEKALRAKIPLKERNAWETWLAETAAEIHELTSDIVRIEDAMNTLIYDLFGLQPHEVSLIEARLADGFVRAEEA